MHINWITLLLNTSSYSLIFLILKSSPSLANYEELPECTSNYDCVIGGVCIKDSKNRGRCFCSSSCPNNVPVQCYEYNHNSCASMGELYNAKYGMHPLCYHRRCICPPMFDHSTPRLMENSPPRKCDRRQLDTQISVKPSETLYKGTTAHIFCCLNVDPRGFIPIDGVYFVQNGTRKREPNITPFESFSSDIDTLFTVPTCWVLVINNVQISDAGSYMCMVQPLNAKYRTVNASMEFSVKEIGIEENMNLLTRSSNKIRKSRKLPAETKATEQLPRMIRNLNIVPNTTTAVLTWDEPDQGSALNVDINLYRRSDGKTRIWHRSSATSPVTLTNLTPGTSYTLILFVKDGRAESVEQRILTEQFQTLDGLPDVPVLEDIRIVNGDVGQLCEIEWRPPRRYRGTISRYYVKIAGKIRYVHPDKDPALYNDHFPQGTEVCINYNIDDKAFIDAGNFRNFFACKYGPLKPNRNYTAVLWAENNSGKSNPVAFSRQCIMDFAEPDYIDPPETVSRTNMSSFELRFSNRPNENNGPIGCFFLAVLPLPTNISVTELPSPELIVIDSYDKVIQNNLYQSVVHNRFFAYIAESYTQLPAFTVIGDGDISGGMDSCSVQYLTRYKPTDPALVPELKYTGFMIVRVERDSALHTRSNFEVGRQSAPRRPIRSFRELPLNLFYNSLENEFSQRRHAGDMRRQLTNLDPAYGFSPYFKPVLLQNKERQNYIELIFFCLLGIISIVLPITILLFFLYRRRYLKHLCPIKKKHDILWSNIVNPPLPIKSEDIPTEYILRHRDSDYQFSQEFEMLPKGKNLDHTISERKENQKKNRYNDIKACDATRVRLHKLHGEVNSSDYINANFIKGYKSRKIFIATQGPLDSTIVDFWRMVWEQRCKIIIMVTNLREKGREQCVKYWPDEDIPLISRTLEVRQIDSVYYADYTIRNFELVSVEEPSSRSVNDLSSNSLKTSLVGKNLSDLRSPALLSKQISNNFAMNNSLYSIHSQQSVPSIAENPRPTSLYNSSTIVAVPANKFDAEYANISTVIVRPYSKNSRRADSMEAIREKRHVVQYHFTSWNDYKAPECAAALLRLIYKLRKINEYNTTPIVIHCSAGVGRTGTFIAIDYIMDQCLEEGRADIFGCVAEMRQQRNFMVQTVEQYVFIYKALAEHILFGDTDKTVPEFRMHITNLRRVSDERERHYSHCSANSTDTSLSDRIRPANQTSTNKSKEKHLTSLRSKLQLVRGGSAKFNVNKSNSHTNAAKQLTLLEHEFHNTSIYLEKASPTEWAQREANMPLNRFNDAVPFDYNRVILTSLIGYDNTYINASRIKAYLYPYIMAQDPIDPETAFDFWRMVNDTISYTIVMLSEEQFDNREMYWPQEINKRLLLGKTSELTITLSEETINPTFIRRTFHYRFKNERGIGGRDVVQFSFRHWASGAPIPNSRQAFLDLIGVVLERQSNIPDAGPIILHCRDGSAENGLFCCISMLLERLKAEQMIDVFRTVKSLQLQRPQVISKIEQYAFCYDCLNDYIDIVSTSL